MCSWDWHMYVNRHQQMASSSRGAPRRAKGRSRGQSSTRLVTIPIPYPKPQKRIVGHWYGSQSYIDTAQCITSQLRYHNMATSSRIASPPHEQRLPTAAKQEQLASQRQPPTHKTAAQTHGKAIPSERRKPIIRCRSIVSYRTRTILYVLYVILPYNRTNGQQQRCRRKGHG